MKYTQRTDEQIRRDITSAGQSFLGLRLEDLLLRISELEDKDRKKKLIDEYYTNQIGTYDETVGGTTTRVNAAIRIIKANKVIYALEKIDGSNSRVLPSAVNSAKELIKKIEVGKIQLPHLS